MSDMPFQDCSQRSAAAVGVIPSAILIAELELAIANASAERRAAILTHVTRSICSWLSSILEGRD